MLNQQLQELGLNEKEALVYICCLQLGESTVLTVSRETKLNRTTVYDAIHSLEEKKLVLPIYKGKRVYYHAEAPDKIKTILKEKIKKLDKIMPELRTLINNSKVRPKIQYLEGLEGLKNGYRHTLNSKEPHFYGFTGFDKLLDQSPSLLRFWEKEYIPAREKRELFCYLVIPDNETGKAIKAANDISYRETRFVPGTTYNFECEFIFYDNQVVILSTEKNQEFALILESNAIANTLKMIWQIVWNVAY